MGVAKVMVRGTVAAGLPGISSVVGCAGGSSCPMKRMFWQ